MVLIQIRQNDTAQVLLKSATTLATQLKKTVGVLSFVDNDELIDDCEAELK